MLVPRGWLGKKEKSPVPKRFLLRLCRVGFLQELRAGVDPGPLFKLRRTFQQEGWETGGEEKERKMRPDGLMFCESLGGLWVSPGVR